VLAIFDRKRNCDNVRAFTFNNTEEERITLEPRGEPVKDTWGAVKRVEVSK